MGVYRDQVLPRIQNKVMDREPNRAMRARACEGLAGTVVEVGFGTGLNAPFYPDTVDKVIAIEPSQVCMRIAAPRIDAAGVSVELGGLTGERLDLPSGELDAVLSTWTLCTIPNLDAALAELHRVLRPGGTFHFVEHGRAPDAKVARWQARIEPVWKRVAGGCHVTRRIDEEVVRAGFEIERLDAHYVAGEPKAMGYTFEGRAIRR